jgi:hypothetical protein
MPAFRIKDIADSGREVGFKTLSEFRTLKGIKDII